MYNVWAIFSLSSSTLSPPLLLLYLASYQQEGMQYKLLPAQGFFLLKFFFATVAISEVRLSESTFWILIVPDTIYITE